MACISKHGEAVQISYLFSKVQYCEDGNVLRNVGYGWKKWKKIVAGKNWKEVAQKAIDRKNRAMENEMYYAFEKLIQDTIGKSLEKRSLLHTGLQMLYDDPDGLYSEFQNQRALDVSYEDVKKLCMYYKFWLDESKK